MREKPIPGEDIGAPDVGGLEDRKPVLGGLLLEMGDKDRLYLIAPVKERGGIGIGGESRAIQQLTKLEDRTHRKREIAIGSRVDAVWCAEVRVGIIDGAAFGRLTSIIQIGC